MEAFEIRKKAREILNGRWGKVAVVTLVYLLFNLLVSFISAIPVIGTIFAIGNLVITVPVSAGMLISYLRIKRGEDVEVFDFLTYGFENFARTWKVAGNILLKVLIPLILLIVSIVVMALGGFSSMLSAFSSSNYHAANFFILFIGFAGYIASIIVLIIQSLHYVFAYQIAYDHPEMQEKDCVEESKNLMENKRGKLFYLYLTFLGWSILAGLINSLLSIIFGNFLAIPTIGLYACLCFLHPYIYVSVSIFYDNLNGKDTAEKQEEKVMEEAPTAEPQEIKEEPKQVEEIQEVTENVEKEDKAEE